MFYAFKENCIWFSFILMWLCLCYGWGNGTTQEVYKIIWILYIMRNVYLTCVKCNFPVSYSRPDRKHTNTWHLFHTLVSMYSMLVLCQQSRKRVEFGIFSDLNIGSSLMLLTPFPVWAGPTVVLDAVLTLLTELLWYVYEVYCVVYHMGCIFFL